MRILLSTGSLHIYPLELSFKVAKESGCDGVEWVYQCPFDIAKAEKLSKISPVKSVHAPFMKTKDLGCVVKGFKKAVEFAKALGAEVVVMHPPCVLDPQIRYLIFFFFTRDFCLEYGGGRVLITVENMPYWGRGRKKFPAYLGGTLGGLYRLCKRKNLFITFDTCHIGTKYPDKVVDAFNVLYETGRVVNIHFSDYREGIEHLPPGEGVLPLEGFLENLKEVGYKEFLTIELDPRNLPKGRAEAGKAVEKVVHFVKSRVSESFSQKVSSFSRVTVVSI